MSNVKRFIGRKFDDTYVQKLKNSDDYRFKIVKGDEGQTEVEVRYDGLIVRKSPEEICSEILKNMKESASEYLGTPVTEAVISVPAYFSNAQRKATKLAAELSGLTVLKLITEPVAAAIHYAQDRLNTNSTLLVFDFGGVERALGIMTKCLKGAGLTKENITDVLLVGGSTRIPKIREKLTSLFGVNKIRTNLNPDQAVALGADEDGILEVSARETSTGKHNKLIVTLGEFRLCDHEIRQCIENAEQNKKDDELFGSYVPNALIFKSLQ
ncbi:hypothetical protein HUJ05_012229 [Dendroctonus ponderosae]|nr:hypothetical protein HUJ05_012229 [Dendroctonus ponderosae]